MQLKGSRIAMAAITAVILGVTATACSGGGSGDSGDSGDSGVINIGALNPLTGAGATYGPGMLDGIKIAVDEVNTTGGPLGKKLKVNSADDQSDPSAAVTAAEKLVNVNKVSAILGTYSSAVTLAVSPIALRKDVIVMNTSGAPEVSQQGPLSFQFNPRENLYGAAEAGVAIEKGYKTAAILSMNNPAGQGNADSFTKDFEKLGGKVLTRVDFQEKQTSYRAELGQVLRTHPDVVLIASYVPDATIIIKESRTIDPDMKWVGPAFGLNQLLADTLGADLTEGLIGVDSIPSQDSSTYKNYSQKFKKSTGKEAFGNTYAAMTYDMVNMYALAVQAAGTTESKAVAEAMHKISGSGGTKVSSFEEGQKALKAGDKIDYQGASGPLKFNKTNNRGVYFGVFEITKGKAVLKETITSTTNPDA